MTKKIYLKIQIEKEVVEFAFSDWIDFKDFLEKWYKHAIIKEWDMRVIEKS